MRTKLIGPRRMAGTAGMAVLAILALVSTFGCEGTPTPAAPAERP